jgi:hypothetical protein
MDNDAQYTLYEFNQKLSINETKAILNDFLKRGENFIKTNYEKLKNWQTNFSVDQEKQPEQQKQDNITNQEKVKDVTNNIEKSTLQENKTSEIPTTTKTSENTPANVIRTESFFTRNKNILITITAIAAVGSALTLLCYKYLKNDKNNNN